MAERADPVLPTQLTKTGGALTGAPRWSPDGNQIAFDSRPEGSSADIYVMDVGTKQVRRITDDAGEDVVPSWSRDGQWIYFSSNRGGSSQVWKVAAAGGTADQITSGGGFAPAESNDGRYVYYAKGRTVSGLWRVPVEGGAEEPVLPRLKPGHWGYWSLCGNSVYFVDRESPRTPASLFAFEFDSQRLTRLFEITKPLVMGDVALSVAHGCDSALFAQRDQSGSDIMLVDLAAK
jgi:dipeptidyl aminopeptidase/acylaminoacyl peptidase